MLHFTRYPACLVYVRNGRRTNRITFETKKFEEKHPILSIGRTQTRKGQLPRLVTTLIRKGQLTGLVIGRTLIRKGQLPGLGIGRTPESKRASFRASSHTRYWEDPESKRTSSHTRYWEDPEKARASSRASSVRALFVQLINQFFRKRISADFIAL